MKKPSRRASPHTVEIVRELTDEATRALESGSVDHGFRARLAKKYGLTRGRISNIAREFGLADQTRSTRAKAFKARLKARHEPEADGGPR